MVYFPVFREVTDYRAQPAGPRAAHIIPEKPPPRSPGARVRIPASRTHPGCHRIDLPDKDIAMGFWQEILWKNSAFDAYLTPKRGF